MTENGIVTLKLSKMSATVLTTLLGLAVAALATNLYTLNRGLLEIQLWKTSLDAQDSIIKNTLPRSEWVLEKVYLSAEIEQLRARIASLELQDRPR